MRGRSESMAEHWAGVAGVGQPIHVRAAVLTDELIMLLMIGKWRYCSSVSKKANSLFFTIGPPMLPPTIWRTSGGSMAANRSRAFKDRLRKNQKAMPWTSLVPLLVMVLTTPPDALPNSAE